MIGPSASRALFEAGERLPESLVVFLASYLIWVMAVLLLIALWRARTTRRAAILLAGSALLAYGANALIGFLIVRPRPFVSGEVAHALISTAHLGGSYPSDHAAIAWALGCAYALMKQKNAWLFLGMAFLVSVGRVLAGVHFVEDAAVGALVGLGAALAVRLSLRIARVRAIVSR
ncbi:MAG: phosphatase PAP2 family protein [Parcubacteria group bacterium]|nr:phosphatase PAP2 family protein [Parcubacteria group bacterium]